jgi:hypothetical protein
LIGGCKGGANLPALAPVKGKVTVDGKSVTSGQVVLIPETPEKGKEGALSAGQIDADGNYEISTGGKSGAPLGKHKVTVTPPTMPMPGAKGPPKGEFNQKKYGDQKSTPLSITVVENPAPGAYDLKLTK